MNTFKQILSDNKNVVESIVQNMKSAGVDGVSDLGVSDPRPDLIEDSALWATFLTLVLAAEGSRESRQLYGALHGFRCMGTRLVKAGVNAGDWAGMYVLRPDTDPDGAVAWESREKYEEFKKRYLAPMESLLFKALRKLNHQIRKVS